MENPSSIEILIVDVDTVPANNMFPSPARLVSRLVSIDKDVLAKSLDRLISQVGSLLANTDFRNEQVELDTISITVEITADGGLNWIGSAKAGITNGMTLTLKPRMRE